MSYWGWFTFSQEPANFLGHAVWCSTRCSGHLCWAIGYCAIRGCASAKLSAGTGVRREGNRVCRDRASRTWLWEGPDFSREDTGLYWLGLRVPGPASSTVVRAGVSLSPPSRAILAPVSGSSHERGLPLLCPDH